MKFANNIKIRVFCHPEEDEQKIREALISLVDLDLEKEKIVLEKKVAKGFDQKTIVVFYLNLCKDRHSNYFLKRLKNLLSDEDKDFLCNIRNNVDSDLKFYVRLDKNSVLAGKPCITDSGNCFHLTISLAVFPRNTDNAYELVNNILN